MGSAKVEGRTSAKSAKEEVRARLTFCTVKLLTMCSNARSFNSVNPILSAKR